MNKPKIKQYYKILSLITLFLSVASLFYPNELPINEKFGTAIGLNIAFHLVFQFLSRAPIGLYEQGEKNNPKHRKLAHKMMTWFSIAIMVVSVIGILGFLNTAFSNQEYERLFGVTIFAGIFLGGYSSKLELDEKVNAIP